MFVGGAAYSFFEGARTLSDDAFHERSTGELALAFTVLGLASCSRRRRCLSR